MQMNLNSLIFLFKILKTEIVIMKFWCFFQINLLKKKDTYGHYKLAGEEALGNVILINLVPMYPCPHLPLFPCTLVLLSSFPIVPLSPCFFNLFVHCAVHYGKKDGLNWVTLRLADVIGPRDTTYR